LAGESFAGQYIPYIGQSTAQTLRYEVTRLIPYPLPADAILKSDIRPSVSLVGVAIGNGWIDPREQYQGYVDFAYEKGLIKQDTKVSLVDFRVLRIPPIIDDISDD